MEKIKNDLSQKFSKGIILPHWLSAVLILMLFFQGIYMKELEMSEKMGLIKLHANLGSIVLILSIIRTVSLFKTKRPEHLKTGSVINDKLVVWTHRAFYFLIFAILLSGFSTMIIGGYGEALQTGNNELVKAFDEIPPLQPHGIMSFILMILVGMHVVGFAKHLILKKENTLKRIF